LLQSIHHNIVAFGHKSYFIAGDPHKLDRDKDGIACEKPKR